MKQRKKLDNSLNSSIIFNIFLNFPSNSQTLPFQITLDLIASNSLKKSIFTEALN